MSDSTGAVTGGVTTSAPAVWGSAREISAGRGVLYISAAKMYFMLAGAAIEFVLPHLLGRFLFGAYAFVAQSVSNLNNVMVTGTIQAVSRYTTADPARAGHVKASGFKMHLLIGLPIAVAFAALSPLWASLAHDPSKIGPLALSAAIVCGYAFYAVLVGSANGTRQFHKQAGLDVTFATLRACGIVGASALGLGVYGAIGGWVAAVALILLFAAAWVGLPRGATADPVGPMARYLGGVAVYLVLLNLLMSVDLFLLKRLSAEWYHAREVATAEAARLADGQVGFYRAVQNLARLPYQLLIAVTFVIFPLVSRATFEGDREKAASYVRTTIRYSLMFAGLTAIPLAANPGPMIDIPYPSEFAQAGGPALAALALGNVAFSLFSIAGTILNGAGLTREAVKIAAITLAASALSLWIAIPRFEPGRPMLLACAAATGGSMWLGAVASGWVIRRKLGAFVTAATILRVTIAAATAIAVGRVIPATRPLPTLLEAAGCAIVFALALVATGELRRTDLRAILRGRYRRD